MAKTGTQKSLNVMPEQPQSTSLLQEINLSLPLALRGAFVRKNGRKQQGPTHCEPFTPVNEDQEGDLSFLLCRDLLLQTPGLLLRFEKPGRQGSSAEGKQGLAAKPFVLGQFQARPT